jgi:hypothetical protein
LRLVLADAGGGEEGREGVGRGGKRWGENTAIEKHFIDEGEEVV